MWRTTLTAGVLAATAALAALLAAAPAQAAAPSFDPLPMKLPPAGNQASIAAQRTWILGIRPSAQGQRIAADHGASRISDGAVVLPASRVREAAAALAAAGMLRYAEPDVRRSRASSWDGFPEQWARGAVVPPETVAPPLGRATIGLIDDQVDATHADLAGHTTLIGGMTMTAPHGTMVASVASATSGNGGVMGVFPSAPIMSYGTSDLSCSDIVRGIDALVDRRVDVINISLGSPLPCVAEHVAVEQAIGEGVVVVAAAGNEYQSGNPVEFPAAYPHVLSVASVRQPDYAPSGFSNANAAIDLSAPGEGVPVAIPVAYDIEDGVTDGVTVASGTSFSAPIVAGAAAWLRSVRVRFSGMQIAEVLRNGAVDLGPKGWDQDTGWGLVSVPGAISAPDPMVDPFEPNDDIPFVNGTYFQGADPLVYRGRDRRLVATVDFAEDPYDVYRIKMPTRSSLKAEARPQYGDPDLLAFHGGARYVSSRRAIVDRSERYRGPDRVYLINTSRRSVVGYLVVRASSSEGTIDSRYTLSIVRTRYRR